MKMMNPSALLMENIKSGKWKSVFFIINLNVKGLKFCESANKFLIIFFSPKVK